MKTLIIISYLILALSESSHAVVGGKSVTDSKLRNSVVMLFTPSGNCTGILLDEKTVITAAHCLLNEDGEKELNVSVGYFGQSSLPSSLQDAKEVLSYKMEAGKDVGLVFLTDKFSRDENDSLPILSLPEISDEDEFCLVGTGQNNSMSLQILCDFHFIALFFFKQKTAYEILA